MTPSELKYNVENTGSYFFTRNSMKAFGDTMKNYGVRSVIISSHTQKNIDCWELYRKRPVRGGVTQSAYFSKKTFERVHIAV